MILRNSNIKFRSQTPGILSSHSRWTGWSISVPKDPKSSVGSAPTPPFKDMFTSHVVSIDCVIICQMYMWHIWRWTVLTRGGRAGLLFTAQHTGLNNMISISIIVIIIIITTQHTGILFGIILLYYLLREGFNEKILQKVWWFTKPGGGGHPEPNSYFQKTFFQGPHGTVLQVDLFNWDPLKVLSVLR